MKNLCDELKCPFNRDNGCTRYPIALQCPVRYLTLNHPDGRFPEASEYWLFVYDDFVVDNEIQQRFEAMLSQEASQLRLKSN